MATQTDIRHIMEEKALKYLEYYGYLRRRVGKRPEAEVRQAIATFQKVVDLEVTGALEDDILRKVKEPRCLRSNPFAAMTEDSAPPVRWGRQELTYRIVNYTRDLTKEEVDDAVKRALKVWSDVTPLEFVETSKKSDIEMSFKEHPMAPLDGPGGTLAYAFFPGPGIGGDVHFDPSEDWTVHSFSGTNLFIVAAHEFGHSLGLDHSDVQGALMYPYYQGYTSDFKLHQDDINRIQALYGPPINLPFQQPSVLQSTMQSSPWQQ
ncbi:stromelysin-1-like [Branchiostoma floridae x Branchiostoma belcheri]